MKLGLSIKIMLVAIFIGVTECMALTGKWRGNLTMGPTKLPLVFNFSETSAGKTIVTMDSPQQNAKDIPFGVKYCSEDSISLECGMIGATYTGKINGDKIEGNFSQRGYNFILLLTPEEDITARRPQTPRGPFPYIVKDTLFSSSDGTELAGTLVLPEAYQDKKFPTIVMVTGSGPQNRDEEIFEHRPFAVIADYLARNGIASFRFDDRGTAKSKGDYSKATIETFEEDVKSAYRFVKSLPESGVTGILGHSEGGTLAILYGAEETPDFIISLAGMVLPAKETLLSQNIHLMDRLGITGPQKENAVKLIDSVFDEIISQHKAGKNRPIDIDSICQEKSLDVPNAILESIKHNITTRNAYFDSLVSLDPTDALRKVKCPILAINGTKDIQVDAVANLGAFRRFGSNVKVMSMDGLNHLMQHAVTGEVSEYGEIKETISPEVLNAITDFILQQERKR